MEGRFLMPVPRHHALISALGLLAVVSLSVIGWRVYGRGPAASPDATAPSAQASASEGRDALAGFRAAKAVCAPRPAETTVAFVGDIMLSRSVGARLRQVGDWGYSFDKTSDWLRDADLAFGNLETAITPGKPVKSGEMAFRADAETALALARAGFDVLSLANNHTPNFGQAGLRDTFKYLDAAGVRRVGAGVDDFEAWQPAYLNVRGLVVAFIAANDSDVVPGSYGAAPGRAGTAIMDVAKLRDAVAEARPNSDVVVVSMHSGREYVTKPNSRQVTFARAAVDAGADLVVGHHAHVVQEMEIYKGKPILYGLGNFVFDQTWSEPTQEGLAVRAVFAGRELRRLEFLPVRVGRDYRPTPADEPTAARIIARLGYPVAREVSYRWSDNGMRFEPEAAYAVSLGASEGCEVAARHWRVGGYEVALTNGTLKVAREGAEAWTSPGEVWVEDFAPSSVAGEDVFGYATAWQAGEGGAVQHLATLAFADGAAAWTLGAALPEPACTLATADFDGEGVPEAAVTLGHYADAPGCLVRAVAVLRLEGETVNEVFRIEGGQKTAGLTAATLLGQPYFQPRFAP